MISHPSLLDNDNTVQIVSAPPPPLMVMTAIYRLIMANYLCILLPFDHVQSQHRRREFCINVSVFSLRLSIDHRYCIAPSQRADCTT
jgi:hypothetical protein